MKNKRMLLGLILTCGLFGTMSFPASAEVLGGWNEDSGYFTNPMSSSVGVMSDPVIEPGSGGYAPEHKSWKEYNGVSQNLYQRVIGETTWPGTRHWTRAYYETWFGNMEYDSGRQYGIGYSIAHSEWNDGSFVSAKTSYGY